MNLKLTGTKHAQVQEWGKAGARFSDLRGGGDRDYFTRPFQYKVTGAPTFLDRYEIGAGTFLIWDMGEKGNF